MNTYKVQYWLYAILNKRFGSEVKIARDSLHARYEVNRHGMEVSTNTMSILEVKNWFLNNLKESGYILESKDGSSFQVFTKRIKNKKFFISIHENFSSSINCKKTFSVSLHGYGC